jgi:hypothetical protein
MHIKEGFIEHGQQKFQIIVGQITTPHNQVDICISLGNVGGIEMGNNLVANKESFHQIFIFGVNLSVGLQPGV